MGYWRAMRLNQNFIFFFFCAKAGQGTVSEQQQLASFVCVCACVCVVVVRVFGSQKRKRYIQRLKQEDQWAVGGQCVGGERAHQQNKSGPPGPFRFFVWSCAVSNVFWPCKRSSGSPQLHPFYYHYSTPSQLFFHVCKIWRAVNWTVSSKTLRR
jgi:hypothetical protein